MSSPFTVVYLLGAGHCGSTLLSLLLNGHPRCVALSEVTKLARYLRISRDDPRHPFEALFWKEVAARYEAATGRPFHSLDTQHPSWRRFATWNLEQTVGWAQPYRALMQAVFEVSGADHIVDASKSWQQLYLLRRSGLVRLRVIHLIRDGRAVLNSYMRKYGFGESFGQWAKPSIAAGLLRRRFPSSDWLEVRYERLALETEAVLREICSCLGLEYDGDMLYFRRHAWVGIGGNRMVRSNDQQIRLDERWRSELSLRHRALFGILGGPVNRYYGYRAGLPGIGASRSS